MAVKFSLKQALERGYPRRKHDYVHEAGDYVLTASFNDAKIDRSTINLAGALSKHFTQRQISLMLGVGVATVSKLVRIYHFSKEGKR